MTLKRDSVPKSAGRKGSVWRTVKAKAFERDRKRNAPCHLCGQPIDYAAPPGTPDAWEPDHWPYPCTLYPEHANDITNPQPSHCSCNRADGARLKAKLERAKKIGEPSRDWGL